MVCFALGSNEPHPDSIIKATMREDTITFIAALLMVLPDFIVFDSVVMSKDNSSLSVL